MNMTKAPKKKRVYLSVRLLDKLALAYAREFTDQELGVIERFIYIVEKSMKSNLTT